MPEPETTPPRTRVEVDLNVRANGGQARVGFEDADGPLQPGQVVEVFESESGLTGVGTVTAINTSTRIAWIAVDWPKLAEPEPPACETGDVRTCTMACPEHGNPEPFPRGITDVHPTSEPYAYQPPSPVQSVIHNTSPAPTPDQRCSCGGRGVTHFHADRHEPVPAVPVPGLRDQIAGVFRAVDGEFPAWTKRDAGPEAHVDAVLAVVQPYLATAPELEARQRWAWSRLNLCPRCGHEDGKSRLCATCDDEVRRLPAPLRRPWQHFRPLPTGQPIQGHGYTPAGLLGMDDAPEPDSAALTPPVPADQPEGGTR